MIQEGERSLLSKAIVCLRAKQDSRGIVITRTWCAILLAIYAACIFIWDYTIAYQAVLALMFASTLWFYRGRMLRLSPYLVSSGLFLLFFLTHTCVGLSTNIRYSREYLVALTINFAALMCILCIVDTRAKIELVMKALIFTALVIWVYALIVDRSHLFSGSMGAKGATIPKPIFGGRYSHNNLPMFAGYAVLFLTYFRLKNRPIPGTWLLYVFFLACVLMTGARKALMFMLIGLMAYPLLFSKKTEPYSNKTTKLLALVFCLIIAIYLIMTNEKLYEMIGKRFAGAVSGLLEGEFTESSARSRAQMVTTALNSIREHFLLGIGLNNFRTLEGSFHTWSHNNYLEIAVSGGILPLLIYYSFPVYAFFMLRKVRRDPMAGMFFTYLIYLVIHDLLSVSYNARSIGLMLGLIDAFLRIKARETDRAQREFHSSELPREEEYA